MVVGAALGLARALGKTRLPTPKVDSQQRLAALGANLGQAGEREGGEEHPQHRCGAKRSSPSLPNAFARKAQKQELAGKFPLLRGEV